MKKKITIQDIALYSGYSTQTVSRVINNSKNVSDDTRKTIQYIIDKYKYIPNSSAQNLAKTNNYVIGLIITDLRYHTQAIIMRSINIFAESMGFTVIVKTIKDTTIEQYKNAILTLMSQQICGIIISSPVSKKLMPKIHDLLAGTPVVFLDTKPEFSNSYVIHSTESGAFMAIEHLIGLGHKKIITISGPLLDMGSIRRTEGWDNAFKKYELKPSGRFSGDWTAQSGYKITCDVILNKIPFTAVAVVNDQMSLGVIHALYEHGIKVPDDVSVIGFDNEDDSRFFVPALTTIHQDFVGLSQEAVTRLASVMTKRETMIQSLILESELIIRSSTTVARALPDEEPMKSGH